MFFFLSQEERNPCFFGGFSLLFPKKQGKEDQGIALWPIAMHYFQILHLNGASPPPLKGPVANLSLCVTHQEDFQALTKGWGIAIQAALQRVSCCAGYRSYSHDTGGKVLSLTLRIEALQQPCVCSHDRVVGWRSAWPPKRRKIRQNGFSRNSESRSKIGFSARIPILALFLTYF